MEIAKCNRRITINEYTFSHNGSGGNVKTFDDSYTIWANVVNKNGSRTLDNSAITYQKVFIVTKRYEASRPMQKTSEIVYDGMKLSIHSIVYIEEGKRTWEEILCYTNR